MKTILVPVDFTPTSDNAVRYAVEWSKAYGYGHIILLKTLYDSIFESISTSADYVHVNGDYRSREREETTEKLNDVCRNLIGSSAPGIKVSLAVSEHPFLRSVLDVVETEKPELVVIGSDNYRHSSDSFVSGHVIGIARTSPVRVLIVPSHYHYQPVQQALVPVNFNTVSSLSKLDSYQTASPQGKEKKLLVLNVDPKERYLHPDEPFINAENALHGYLKHFNHEVFYASNKNIINGIMDFAKVNDVQMIIALPGRYSFLYSLRHSSISEAIYRNAKEPVLILK